MNHEGSPLDHIMRVTTGAWACAILGAAVVHGLFSQLEEAHSALVLASRARLSLRGTQALLDGLLGLGFVTLEGGLYRSTEAGATFLVEGKAANLGGIVRHTFLDMPRWCELANVAARGAPMATDTADVPDNPFWESLVPSIAVLSAPVALIAADRLGVPGAGAISWLDVGGGSAIYSVTWLSLNEEATATQIDWPNVNRIARAFVAERGFADRFRTIDGDYHTVDFAEARYDIAICSNIAQMEPPDGNRDLFRRLRRALKPGGRLVVSDFVLNDDRTGHPFALMFTSMMLLQTKEGMTYRRADFDCWLREAGFTSISFEPTPTPTVLIFAS